MIVEIILFGGGALLSISHWSMKKQVDNLSEQFTKIVNDFGRVDGVMGSIRQASLASSKEQVDALQTKIDILEFKLEHPQPYQIGDKTKDPKCVVTAIEVKERTLPNFFDIWPSVSKGVIYERDKYAWHITATNIKTGEVKTWEE